MTNKSYNEVLELLKHIPIKDYLKIPREEISKLLEGKDSTYKFVFDSEKSFREQNISREAFKIFTKLYYRYIATEVEKDKIEKMLKINDQRRKTPPKPNNYLEK